MTNAIDVDFDGICETYFPTWPDRQDWDVAEMTGAETGGRLDARPVWEARLVEVRPGLDVFQERAAIIFAVCCVIIEDRRQAALRAALALGRRNGVDVCEATVGAEVDNVYAAAFLTRLEKCIDLAEVVEEVTVAEILRTQLSRFALTEGGSVL